MPRSALQVIVLAALFWNPFPWVEIAVRGHFDILVGLCCLAAIETWNRGSDRLSGVYLAMGVLLKYLPVVLLPFLALDRGRVRKWFLIAAIASIVLGLELSYHIWGPSMFSPLRLAATRRSTCLSIFMFLRGPYSPMRWFGVWSNYDYLSPYLMASPCCTR